jgi:hypothetical protein
MMGGIRPPKVKAASDPKGAVPQTQPLSLSRNPCLAEKLALEDGVDFFSLAQSEQDIYRQRAAQMIAEAERRDVSNG